MSLALAHVLAAAPVAAAGGNGIQDFLAGPAGSFVLMGGMLLFAYLLLIPRSSASATTSRWSKRSSAATRW